MRNEFSRGSGSRPYILKSESRLAVNVSDFTAGLFSSRDCITGRDAPRRDDRAAAAA